MSVSGPVDVMVPFEVVATATAVALLLVMLQLLLLEVPLTLVPIPLLLLLLLLLLLELLDEVPHSGAGEEVALLQLVGIGLLVGFGEVSSPLRLARLVARAEIRRLRSSRRSDLSGDTCG